MNTIYVFDRFRLDARKRLLFAGDVLITLRPKTFDTLLALVENCGSVMSKEQLMSLLWADEFVEENNLAQHIHAIRKSLGDGIDGARYVETIPRRGYRFIADVAVLDGHWPARSMHDRFGETRAGEPRAGLLAAPAAGAVSPQFAPESLRAAAILNHLPPVSIKPQTQYAVSTGDVNIAYQVVGDGPLDLVFVMGWVSHLEYFWQEPSFARFLTRLSSFSRLILFDKRGTGLSDQVALNDLPTLEQRMTDIRAVMDAVGSKRAVLLGVSEGGPICSLFAATYPEQTVALIMIGTYAKRLWSEDYPWAPTRNEQARFLEEVRRNWGGPVGIKERAPSMADDPQFRDWWATYLRHGASPGAALALTQMNAEIDVRNVLPVVSVPTLVIHRRGDACLPVEGGRYSSSLVPNAKFVELDGNDHLPFVGDQEAILTEIEAFLADTQPARRPDRVLATMLFVLFESSSRSGEAEARLRIDAQRELTCFRGHQVEMTDRYLLAAFDGPARAIQCARAIAAAAAGSGLSVRAGLHTGECDRLGAQISGIAVELSQVIATLAPTGEVLVSHTVKDLVAGSGIEFELCVIRTFSHPSGDWRLFAVGGGHHH